MASGARGRVGSLLFPFLPPHISPPSGAEERQGNGAFSRFVVVVVVVLVVEPRGERAPRLDDEDEDDEDENTGKNTVARGRVGSLLFPFFPPHISSPRGAEERQGNGASSRFVVVVVVVLVVEPRGERAPRLDDEDEDDEDENTGKNAVAMAEGHARIGGCPLTHGPAAAILHAP
ncbi:MAG: hypothetical protein FJ290_25680 [Planctomycetes bacterium]|nr:hypothetical protein [Planctomycetota bacterium]